MVEHELSSESTRDRRAGSARPSNHRVWMFASAMAVVGAIALTSIWSAHSGSNRSGAFRIDWWVLAVLFATVEPVHVPVSFRSRSVVVTLRELPLALGLLTSSPRSVVLASLVGPIVVELFRSRRRPTDHVALSFSSHLMSGGLAAAAFHVVAGTRAITRPIVWFGAVASAMVAALVAHAIVVAMKSHDEHHDLRSLFGAPSIVAVGAAAMNASFGALVAVTAAQQPVALALLILPAVGCVFVYRSFVSDHVARSDLTFLSEAAQAVSTGVGEMVMATTGVLDRLCTSVGANFGEIWLVDEAGALRRWVSVGTGSHVTPLLSVLDEVERSRGIVIDNANTRSVAPNTFAFTTELGLTASAVHPLVHDETTLGLIVVGTQGSNERFRSGHADLISAFARHLAIRLASNRLGEAVDELARQRNELAVRASQDVLTGLANRMLFFGALDELIRTGRSVTVAFIDLDDFKKVNDDHGHGAGDRALQHVARALRSSFRSRDVVARLGGDEFAVLAVDTSERDTKVAARRAVELIAQPFDIGGISVRVGASIGLAGHAGAENGGTLLARADAALYRAKRAGKGCVVVADAQPPRTDVHALDHGPRRT
jgi:diguanylate cyclase (GGDEF)-like protein